MRFERIQSILESEPVFRSRMIPKICEVAKKPDEKRYYSRLVYDVTVALHASSSDPHNAPKSAVLMKATEVAELLGANPRPVTVPALSVAGSAQLAPETSALSADTQPRSKRAYRKKPKPNASVSDGAPDQPVQTVGAAHESQSEIPPVDTVLPQAVAPVICAADQTLLIYSNLAKMSLAACLKNLMQLDDDSFPGFEKRREAVDFLLVEYIRLKDIPAPAASVRA